MIIIDPAVYILMIMAIGGLAGKVIDLWSRLRARGKQIDYALRYMNEHEGAIDGAFVLAMAMTATGRKGVEEHCLMSENDPDIRLIHHHNQQWFDRRFPIIKVALP